NMFQGLRPRDLRPLTPAELSSSTPMMTTSDFAAACLLEQGPGSAGALTYPRLLSRYEMCAPSHSAHGGGTRAQRLPSCRGAQPLVARSRPRWRSTPRHRVGVLLSSQAPPPCRRGSRLRSPHPPPPPPSLQFRGPPPPPDP